MIGGVSAIIIGVIVVAGIAYLPLSSINSAITPSACSTTNMSSTSLFVNNQSGSYGAVLLMDKGSKATLCLTYSYSASNVKNGPAESGPYAGGVRLAANGNGDPTSLVTFTSNPINYTVPVHNETVTYTITASENSIGFYYAGFTLQCRPTALAVGYTSSHVNYSDFRGYLGFVSCPFAQIANIQISGFSGLHIMYLQRNCTVDGVAPSFC